MGNNGTLGIIADDMTGALMVAAYYETAGIRTAVVTDIEAIRECVGEAVVIWAGRTRLAEPDEANRQITRAADAFDAIGCDQVIYKVCASFDSTNRAMLGLLPICCAHAITPAVFYSAPAFPSSTPRFIKAISSIEAASSLNPSSAMTRPLL